MQFELFQASPTGDLVLGECVMRVADVVAAQTVHSWFPFVDAADPELKAGELLMAIQDKRGDRSSTASLPRQGSAPVKQKVRAATFHAVKPRLLLVACRVHLTGWASTSSLFSVALLDLVGDSLALLLRKGVQNTQTVLDLASQQSGIQDMTLWSVRMSPRVGFVTPTKSAIVPDCVETGDISSRLGAA